MFEAILQNLAGFDTIIIHRHHHPDGDAIGSQEGLKQLLRANYPDKTVLTVGDPAGRYSFLAPDGTDEVPDEAYENALAIVLDTSAPALISDERYTTAKKTARIDHHLFCGQICEVEVTDSSYESCCGLITELCREAGWKLTPEAARALYAGMVTDSGRFRYDSTASRTFELASFLMTQPVDLTELYGKLYSDTLKNAKTRASFIVRIETTEQNVAWLYNDKATVEASGMSPFSVSRGMVGTMADLEGIPVWVNFTEDENGVQCELRSSTLNINPIAVKYGGGGHQKASGCSLPDKETAMKLLEDLNTLVREARAAE